MKLIQHNNGDVIVVFDIRRDATMENIALAREIPEYEHKDNHRGVLKYNESFGLYWDYVEVTDEPQISARELQEMIEEVM